MADRAYFRPLAQHGRARPNGARSLAGSGVWFSHCSVVSRAAPERIVRNAEVPRHVLDRLSALRPPLCGLSLDVVRIMGILNVTPDSFSDGGLHHSFDAAVARGEEMRAQGADILDIGGESTRPGAAPVSKEDETARVVPVIDALGGVVSVDTRKSTVARPAIAAGAGLINDVSALTYDADMLAAVAQSGAAVCLMHAQGDPKTMQDDPVYDNVALDIYDYLAARVAVCEAAGVPRGRIIVDPGIGFGKTQAHNLALIRNLSLFHGLGCAVLLGVSRKRFIGSVTGVELAQNRLAGSLALALEGVRQGVQMLRVHDIEETRQAIKMWQATL